MDIPHKSVLLDEVLQVLKPRDNGNYLDCTFGAGGYTRAILQFAKCNVIAIDRDITTKKFANEIKNERFTYYNMKFSEIDKLNMKFDGIVFDIGVSSMQIDDGSRGFSFQKDAPFDMRMGNNELSASDIVNLSGEGNLSDIIYKYGDEVKARHIAKKIVANRPLNTTFELANIVRSFYPKRSKIDPATKTFQAIRIAVNNELDELEIALDKAKSLLNDGGRIVVVSFHSLEDKIVKNFVKKLANNKKVDKYKDRHDEFREITKKPISPTNREIAENVRSRSAKLRGIEKCWTKLDCS
ncbi:MAG: 16S rRNA (cytosine(1402)-N(4))-methyltransferase RsmH [Rickettsiales bacterium]|jgi:16S rRNA (cytosine1402-N4)-methyltransferase|nr:16S rRNA (cytosine(1402)-N(4))-methyltransferase RsmH [Rickettsiales bacterium]